MTEPTGPWRRAPVPRPLRRRWLGVFFILALGVMVFWLVSRFPGALARGTSAATLVQGVLLATLAGAAIAQWRGRWTTAMLQVAAWTGIALVLALGYAYRGELGRIGQRLGGELLPHTGTTDGEGGISFPADADGHFRLEAFVDGVRIRFLVDTGATQVVLSMADAARLGLTREKLRFTATANTANGTVRVAPVTLGEIAVGPIRVTNVRASVNEGALSESLLGMSFLGRTGDYAVSGGRLTLSPRPE